MAADDAARRSVLVEHGVEVPERGKLGARHHAIYEQIIEGTWSPQASEMDEQTPRPVSGSKAAGRSGGRSRGRSGGLATDVARSLWGNARKAAKPEGKSKPWVSTAAIIEHFWSQLAWSARPLPPLQKILAAQAPMAGVILEDASKGTVIDRVFLQAAARAENRLEAVNAMVGPPAWVMMISLWGGAQVDPASGAPMIDDAGMWVWDQRTQGMVSGLRFSLMSWLKIADRKADEIMANSDELIALGAEADKLIAYILAPADPGLTPKQVEQEAAAKGAEFVRSSQAARAAGPVTLDDTERVLNQMAGASAMRPVPATGSGG